MALPTPLVPCVVNLRCRLVFFVLFWARTLHCSAAGAASLQIISPFNPPALWTLDAIHKPAAALHPTRAFIERWARSKLYSHVRDVSNPRNVNYCVPSSSTYISSTRPNTTLLALALPVTSFRVPPSVLHLLSPPRVPGHISPPNCAADWSLDYVIEIEPRISSAAALDFGRCRLCPELPSTRIQRQDHRINTASSSIQVATTRRSPSLDPVLIQRCALYSRTDVLQPSRVYSALAPSNPLHPRLSSPLIYITSTYRVVYPQFNPQFPSRWFSPPGRDMSRLGSQAQDPTPTCGVHGHRILMRTSSIRSTKVLDLGRRAPTGLCTVCVGSAFAFFVSFRIASLFTVGGWRDGGASDNVNPDVLTKYQVEMRCGVCKQADKAGQDSGTRARGGDTNDNGSGFQDSLPVHMKDRGGCG
ncbi:hypothetical protein DFH09DRAFT_1095363 [Mycena vulgaris]|nr:hypothetical protein DFH09DRAFT_1095363 [Mycena vulgaris]